MNAPRLAAFALALAPRLALAQSPAPAPVPCTEASADSPTRGPAPAAILSGDAARYEPLLRFAGGDRCMALELPVSLAGRVEGVSRFPVDRDGSKFGGASVSPELRLGARFTSGTAWAPFGLLAEAEADLPTGTLAKAPDVAGKGYPGDEGLGAELRKLHARASLGRIVHLDVGANTSWFGMGLVSNDGAHGWEPGSASFADPRGGDRVLRAQLATGPDPVLGLAAAFGGDRVIGDDQLLDGDSARQVFTAVLIGVGKPHSAGFMLVRRHQENAAARATDVTVLDGTAKTSFALGGVALGLETEWAYVRGSTELGATLAHTVHDVKQVGGAARASIDAGMLGGVIDFLFASGDQNPYDGRENAFRVDPNYAFGLLLFRQVVAAQTARTVGTAGDPLLVGAPAADLERVPTRGNPTNTLAFFPKLRVRPAAGLEAYGGPIFAFTDVPAIDPFTTEIAGGSPRSALGGEAGRYLGTEVDVGVRYRAYVDARELTLGLEGGVLSPGDAFRTQGGATMGAVYGARAMARARF